jgi:NAD(P)-dependent dehydrogenase (short-subunit alcohol dehydrogenase family)
MMSQKMLEGKVAVITGSGRGIGRAMALVMAENGAKVVVNDVGAALDGQGHDATPAQQVVREIEAANGQGTAVANSDSVADWDAAQRIVKTAIDRYGRIDIVVNNAGILRDTIFHRMTPEEFDAVVKVHLYGAFYVSRAAIPYLRAQESGSLIHMTSTSGLIGSVGQVNYSAAKLGIAGLSRGIAGDTARYKVRSNCIAPHAFSRMIESVPGVSEAQMQERAARTRPDQVAQLAAFLACDAAAEVTGQIMGARGNEIYLYSQPRPIRTVHRGTGWSAETLAATLLPAWRGSLTPLERTRDVYPWEAI